MNEEKEKNSAGKHSKQNPEYETPTIISYSEEELLNEIGPIQACSGFGGSVIGC